MRLTKKNLVNEFQPAIGAMTKIERAYKLLDDVKNDLLGGYYGDLESKLEDVNRLLDLHGVEPIRKEGEWDNYFGDIIALYLNTGETYESTVLIDVRNLKITIRSVGDFIEAGYR